MDKITTHCEYCPGIDKPHGPAAHNGDPKLGCKNWYRCRDSVLDEAARICESQDDTYSFVYATAIRGAKTTPLCRCGHDADAHECGEACYYNDHPSGGTGCTCPEFRPTEKPKEPL